MPIGWNESVPSGTSSAALGDDDIVSLKTTLAIAFSEHMYFPGSGGGSAASAGQFKPGAARAFYAAQSLVSANTDGFLMVASDTSRLFGVGSTGMMFLGSARMVEGPDWTATNVRYVASSGTIGNGATVAFGFNYNSVPSVVVSGYTSQTTFGVAVVSAVTVGGFTSNVYRQSGAAYGNNLWIVHWQSLGTVNF